MQLTMWLVAAWAILLPLGAIAVGALQMRRDSFFLLFYVQAVAYVNIAPLFASVDVSVAMKDRYLWIQWWALILFQLPMLVIYCRLVHRQALRHAGKGRMFQVSGVRLKTFIIGATLLGVGYFIVAMRYGLVYRRIGGEELASAQLRMSLPEFTIYRVFLELGLFLSGALLLVLRLPSNMTPHLRSLARVGFAVATILYLGYAGINSRLSSILAVAFLVAVLNVTAPPGRGMNARMLIGLVMAALAAVYTMRVVENIRLSYANGGGVFAVENFLPVRSREGRLDDTLRWRMNGIDLIAIVADNVEAQGAAHGAAWVMPFLLSLDPIVHTPFTGEAKRAALTSSKIWLLLRYGGVSRTDYYSCMLSDVYGNFSVAGFFLAAVVVGIAMGYASGALSASQSPAAVVIALFAMSRLLPFEQEFANVLFGWFKLVPFLMVGVALYPLRRASHPAQYGDATFSAAG